MRTDIVLGDKVKDRITGLVGIAVGKNIWMNGCVQYCVKPPMKKDGTVVDGVWVDEEQLVVVGDGVCSKPKPTGGGFRQNAPEVRRG